MNHPTTMNLSTATPSGLTIPTQSAKRARIKGTRQTYSAELRAQALHLIAQGHSQAAVARELGVIPNTVSSWAQAARVAELAKPGASPMGGIRSELLALRQSLQGRLAVLDRERDALSKTLASVRDALAI